MVSFGKAPWRIREADLTLRLGNAALTTAEVLDANGMVVRQIPLATVGGGKVLRFPADALYVVLR
ncbi:MAG: hypothetical protein HZB16_07060 [Armatimonadetes bacterium]|nr:hypothetical protein [Armatimonadota bacterium]